MKLNKQVFMGYLKQIALWRVPAEAGTVARLFGTVGASLSWLLLPAFASDPSDHQPGQSDYTHRALCPTDKETGSCCVSWGR